MTLRMQKDISMDVIFIRPNCCLGLLGWGSFCSLQQKSGLVQTFWPPLVHWFSVLSNISYGVYYIIYYEYIIHQVSHHLLKQLPTPCVLHYMLGYGLIVHYVHTHAFRWLFLWLFFFLAIWTFVRWQNLST